MRTRIEKEKRLKKIHRGGNALVRVFGVIEGIVTRTNVLFYDEA